MVLRPRADCSALAMRGSGRPAGGGCQLGQELRQGRHDHAVHADLVVVDEIRIAPGLAADAAEPDGARGQVEREDVVEPGARRPEVDAPSLRHRARDGLVRERDQRVGEPLELAVPADYRSWPKFLSAVQRPDAKQVREIYMNPTAASATAAGGFPQGTVDRKSVV